MRPGVVNVSRKCRSITLTLGGGPHGVPMVLAFCPVLSPGPGHAVTAKPFLPLLPSRYELEATLGIGRDGICLVGVRPSLSCSVGQAQGGV